MLLKVEKMMLWEAGLVEFAVQEEETGLVYGVNLVVPMMPCGHVFTWLYL